MAANYNFTLNIQTQINLFPAKQQISKRDITYISLFNKNLLLNNYYSQYLTQYPKFLKLLQSHQNISLYTPISNLFYTYLNFNNINCKKCLFIGTNTIMAEMILFHNTNKDVDTNFLFLINEITSEEKEFNTNVINKLKYIYTASNIHYEEKYNDEKFYDKYILENNTKDYDLMCYSNTHSSELEDFYFMTYILKNLTNDGTYIFTYNLFSENYIYQKLYILAKYFDNIELKKSIMIAGEFHIVCKNLKYNLTNNDEIVFMNIITQWKQINTETVVNIIDVGKDYPQNIKKIYDSLFKSLNKRAKKIKQYNEKIKLYSNEITDDSLVLKFKESFNNILDKAIRLLERYNMPINPKYENKLINYKHSTLFETITMPSVIMIQIFDYDTICNQNIKYITQKHNSNSNNDNKPLQLSFDGKIIKTKQTERMAAVLSSENNCENNCIEFKFVTSEYNYGEYSYDLSDYSFEKLKNLLNLYKINIDATNPKKWSKVAAQICISQGIIVYVKNKFDVNISRGFVKMYEMCVEFDLINLKENKIMSFHACEAPGHFINAINQYIKSNNDKIKFDWYGNSLNPFNKEETKKVSEYFLADYYGYMEKYSDRWLYGADKTGDITNVDNIKYFKKFFNHGVDIFTSDCGISTSTKKEFFNQELDNSKLFLSQVLVSLSVLKIGGNAVYKIFIPFSESSTMSIIFLVIKFFKFVYFSKPVTSTPENSEIYLIAKNKLAHMDNNLEEYLFSCLRKYDPMMGLFPFEYVRGNFLLQMEKITKKFVKKQIKYLVRTFYYMTDVNLLKDKNIINMAKLAHAQNWCDNVRFKKINRKLYL